jgi:16S rRNA A1518/A1519 N6-dimethyltransferase RsmA/KsgA/DIM1 with predicted DNA glycosylase/AP lyase activity
MLFDKEYHLDLSSRDIAKVEDFLKTIYKQPRKKIRNNLSSENKLKFTGKTLLLSKTFIVF